MAKVRYDYFDALIAQGELAVKEARMLVDALKDFKPDEILAVCAAIHEVEKQADKGTHALFTHIATEFLTPIDREDIAEIALRLDDVVDYIDDVAQQLYMYNAQVIYPPATDMAELIVKVTAALVEVLKEFRNFKKSRDLEKYIIDVNDLEEEADRVYFRSIRDLYQNYADNPVFIMAWSNIFLSLERCVDACENVTDMISTAVLKNS